MGLLDTHAVIEARGLKKIILGLLVLSQVTGNLFVQVLINFVKNTTLI